MKGAHVFPYPKFREYVTAHPGWYYLRHACEVRHSTELLHEKRWRSMRVVPCGGYVTNSIEVGHEEEIMWLIGPDIPDMEWEDQRALYRADPWGLSKVKA